MIRTTQTVWFTCLLKSAGQSICIEIDMYHFNLNKYFPVGTTCRFNSLSWLPIKNCSSKHNQFNNLEGRFMIILEPQVNFTLYQSETFGAAHYQPCHQHQKVLLSAGFPRIPMTMSTKNLEDFNHRAKSVNTKIYLTGSIQKKILKYKAMSKQSAVIVKQNQMKHQELFSITMIAFFKAQVNTMTRIKWSATHQAIDKLMDY